MDEEQQRWHADLGGHAPTYSPSEWARARRIIARLIERTEDDLCEAVTLLLDDVWHRTYFEQERVRGNT